MLKIWGRRTAFNVQKVLWFVAELHLEYEHIPMGGDFGGLNTPEFLAMNPTGGIPVIEDDGIIIWESHTILRYLAATYGNPAYWSGSPVERSYVERWMDWAHTALQPNFINGIFRAYYRTPEEQRNWPLIKESIARAAKHFQILDKILDGKMFLGGKDISLADIPAGTALYRYFELDIERPSLPNVENWYQNLQERKAYRENIMVPFDEMKGRLDY